MIPIELIKPVILWWLGEDRPQERREALAEKAGITISSLENLCYRPGSRKWVTFKMADRLLCAMGVPHYWYSPELYHFYKGNQPDLGLRTCVRPGCGAMFPLKLHGSTKKYCSNRCKMIMKKEKNDLR